jgi:chromosomal replication initiator protein
VVTLRRIIAAAAAEFLMPREVAASVSRTRGAVMLRHIVCLLAREFTSLSTPQIGKVLGDRDHTTILHACRAAQRRIDADPVLATKVKRLRAMFMHDAANTGRRDHG